jgi:O-antigen ligase
MFGRDWIGLLFVIGGCLLAVLLVFFEPFWVVGVIGALTVFGVVMWRLEIGIGFLTFSVVVDSVFRSMGAIGGLWDELFFILAITALIWRFAKEGRTNFNPTGLWWGVAGFLVIAVMSGFNSTLPYGHIVTAIRSVLQGTIIFFVIANAGFDRKTVLHLISMLILCGVVVSGYAVYQKMTGMFTPQEWLDVEEILNVTRATSFTGSPNATAGFLALLVPPAIGMMLKVKKFWAKVIWSGMALSLVLGLYATLNRASWIGLAVGLIVLSIASGKRWWVWIMFGSVTAVIILLPGLKERFISIFSEDFAWRNVTYGRGFRWDTAMEIFKKHPFLGIGPGGFGGAVAYGIQAFGGLYVDNYYFLTLSSYGFPGLAMFLFVLVSAIREAFKGLQNAISRDRLLVAGLIGGMVAFMIHLVAENLWQITPLVISFWLVAGLAFALGKAKREEHENL